MEIRASRASSVVVHRVPPAAADRFVALEREVTRAAEGFPGYLGTDLYPPTEPGSVDWVVVIHFDAPPNLAAWLDSPARAGWLAKVRAEVGGDFRLRTLGAGFGAWFAGQSDGPPGWKMVLTVVLGLFPTVMLIDLAAGRLLGRLGFVTAMLAGNFVSVSILQWAVLPALTKLFAPWLNADPERRPAATAGGVVLIAVLLAAMVFAFRLAKGE